MRKAAYVIAMLLTACGGGSQATVQSSPSAQTQTHGSLADTWTWDGATWHRAATAGPSPRYFASLGYDVAHKQFVLFGGKTARDDSDETWLWDGRSWHMATPAHKPDPRRAAAMAWNPVTQSVLMYGGLVADAIEGHEVGETWSWNGSDWKELDAGPGAPQERRGASMVSTGSQVILYGGNFGNETYFPDTWSWGSGGWRHVDSGPGPAARAGAALAWESSTSTLFVYGGVGPNTAGGPGALGTPLADGWSLSGVKWTALPAGPGSLQYSNAIVATGRFIVLLGMACPHPSDAAWAWDGKSWSQLAKPGITSRWGAALAQAPDGKALLVGGSNQPGC